ncbi:MAG: DUF6178 family protein [Desulfobacula sp.]|nr:DUF6178 family protein [Desulfobacula sp.]
MTDKKDYKLANLENREMKLRTQRHDILVSDAENALDKIIDAPSPATLVQSFPDQDLYYLMHKIGPDDFIPVLSLATSDQWEYILDVEVWDSDRLNIDTITRVFDLMFQADAQRLLRWSIKEKPAFFEFFLANHMTIVVREHDELPPEDFNDYITIDDKFYFRFPKQPVLAEDEMAVPKDGQPAWELIEKMVKLVAQMDLSVFHGLLLETNSILPTEIEEEEFRLKNLRLAEKGFLPTHEAIGIYQPTSLNALRKRPDHALVHEHFDPDIPLPPQFFSEFILGDDLFVKALRYFKPPFSLQLESELAALINKIISADKIKLRTRQDLEKAIQKACAYLNLGLEAILKKELKPELAKEILAQYFIEDIFRTGSRACLKLKTKAVNWFKNSFMNKNHLPLSFLDEEFLGVVGGLLIERPMFFDKYKAGELYRDFNSLSDIKKTQKNLEQIIALDTIIGKLDVDTASFKEGVLTFKTLILTLWAKNRLNMEATLEPIDTAVFKDFFSALFSSPNPDTSPGIQLNDLVLWISEAITTENTDPETSNMVQSDLPDAFVQVLENLMAELDEEYSRVMPQDIDPRFIPHFLLAKRTV